MTDNRHKSCLHAGMQDVDSQTSKALLDFSYHLAIGDMHQAHKVNMPGNVLTTMTPSPLASWPHIVCNTFGT